MDVVAYDTTEPVVVFAAPDTEPASATNMTGESVDLRLVDGIEAALDAIDAADQVDCVVTVAELADGSGLDLLDALRGEHSRPERQPHHDVRGAHDTDLPAIYVPDDGSVAEAEAATARGATVYLPRERAADGELREQLAEVVAGYDRRRQLGRERERFEAFLDHVPVPLYAKDASGRFVATSSYIGTGTEGSPLGRISPAVRDDDRAQESHRDDLRVVETGEPILEKEVRSVSADDVVSWHRTTKHPWRTSHGEVQGVVGIAWDVTEAKEREQELERQRWRLEQFATFTSTELREPVTAAIDGLDRARAAFEQAGDAATTAATSGGSGAADPAGDAPAIPAAAEDAFDAVDAELDRIQALIETLLTMARPQAEALEVEWLDLASAVEQSWGALEGATATLADRHEEPLEVRADPELLRRYLEHLFRNAKGDDEADAGGVESITVGPTASGFFVESDGPSVELPDDPTADAFEYEGAGYRVAIARDIAEAHDWTFDVEPGADGGVRFVAEDCLLRPAGLPAATTGEPAPLTEAGDVGGAEPPGEATREEGGWVVRGGGQNLWRDVCEFYGVWATIEGDARIEARVTDFDPVHEHSKAGVGLYDPGDDAAPIVAIALSGTEATESLGRPRAGDPIASHLTAEGDDGVGVHYRLDRVGDRAILSTSTDGVDWTVVDHRRCHAPERVAAGLLVCSHSRERHSEATFEAVRVTPLEVDE